MATTLLVNIDVAIGQLVYGNGVSFHQPRRTNPHSSPNGESPGDPPNGRSPGGRSLDWNPPRRPQLDPPNGLYKWSTFNPRMFMPPWYQPVVVWYEPINKLPY